MTIVRIAELTAETEVLTDLDYPTVGGASVPTLETSNQHTGSWCYQSNDDVCFGPIMPSLVSAVRMGYWIKPTNSASTTFRTLYVAARGLSLPYESANIFIGGEWASETLFIRRPTIGTTDSFEDLASAPVPADLLALNNYVRIGITHKMDETDGFLSLYVNGVLAITLVGDTRLYGQLSGFGQFYEDASHIWGPGQHYNSAGWPLAYVDDMYVDSIVGEIDHVPPGRIFDVRLPTGAGSNTQWNPSASTNVSCIDDNPNDGDTTRNSEDAADQKDTFTFGSISVPVGFRVIRQIPKVFCKTADSGPLIRVHAYNGSLYTHSDDLTPPADYNRPVRADLDLDPNGDPWTESSVNSSELGYESRGTFA